MAKEKKVKKKLTPEEKQALKEEKKQKRIKAKEEQELQKRIKKESVEREQLREAEEAEVLEWDYGGDADITIGEVKLSNKAKIALIILLVGLIIAGILGYLNRRFIYDFIAKPSVILTTTEADIEVHGEFNYEDYLAAQKYDKRYEIIYPQNTVVNVDKLGSYNVKYTLKTLAGDNTTELKVNVVDTTAPKVELNKKSLILIRGKDTKSFDANKYLKDYSDNYDAKEDLTLSITKTVDWNKDEVEIVYSVKDKSGNIGEAKLPITVNDPPTVPETSTSSGSSNGNSSSNSSSNSNNESNNSSSSSNSSNSNSSNSSNSNSSRQSSSSKNKAYISGVHNVTVKVDSDFSDMVNKLVSGVQGSGYITCDYSSVNLQQAGSYTVTFSSDDGVTKTATVTVVE